MCFCVLLQCSVVCVSPCVHMTQETSDTLLINTHAAPHSPLLLCLRYHQYQHHRRGHHRVHPLPRPHTGCYSLVLQVSFPTACTCDVSYQWWSPPHQGLLGEIWVVVTHEMINMKNTELCLFFQTFPFFICVTYSVVLNLSLVEMATINMHSKLYHCWTDDVCTSLHRSYKQRRYVESEVQRRFCRFAQFDSVINVLHSSWFCMTELWCVMCCVLRVISLKHTLTKTLNNVFHIDTVVLSLGFFKVFECKRRRYFFLF